MVDVSNQPSECVFSCRYGQIAALRWHAGAPVKVLALHGWLDNAASFHRLAPLLPDCDLVAMDFPGHGLSDHRAPGHIYAFFDYALEIPEVLEQLGWDKVMVLGHSLGGAIGQLFSVAEPESVERLVMIENLGAVPSWQPGTTADQWRKAVQKWKKHNLTHRRFYPSVEAALAARMEATPMEPAILRPMVQRGVAKKMLENGQTAYHWRTDKRLRLPSLFRLTESQIQEMLQATSVPTHLILADPVTQALDYPAREQRLKALAPESVHRLPGCHHLHLTQAPVVAELIRAFMLAESRGESGVV